MLLADAEVSGDEPDAGGHPDERVFDALDVRSPRELHLDGGDVRRQDLLVWLLFESEADSIGPRRLARYIRMLIDGYGFALPANAMALATRARACARRSRCCCLLRSSEMRPSPAPATVSANSKNNDDVFVSAASPQQPQPYDQQVRRLAARAVAASIISKRRALCHAAAAASP